MLYELIDRVPAQQDQPNAEALSVKGGTLRLEHVTFGYNAEKPVLQDVSFVAEAGKMTALVGVSGSGKSSILNLLMRFWSPQQGRVLIDGQDLQHVTSDSLYDQIALVSQDVFLFDGTIADNIRRGAPNASQEEVETAARSAHAHDFIMGMEQGYDTPVGEFGARLSGGQRQRISIARAFLKNAPILLLDEPTSALDAETDAAIGEALANLSKGRTTVLVAHRFSTIMQADQIYVLEAGRLVEQGTHADLMRNKSIYERLFSLQTL